MQKPLRLPIVDILDAGFDQNGATSVRVIDENSVECLIQGSDQILKKLIITLFGALAASRDKKTPGQVAPIFAKKIQFAPTPDKRLVLRFIVNKDIPLDILINSEIQNDILKAIHAIRKISNQKKRPENIALSHPVNAIICKSPIISIPLGQDFATYIGHCMLLWGDIEKKFNHLLQTMLISVGTELTHSSFSKRLNAFRAAIYPCFGKHNMLTEMLRLLEFDLRLIAPKRNAIAHGEVSFSNENGGTLVITNGKNERRYEQRYTLPDLRQFFYDVSHIGGRLTSLVPPYVFLDNMITQLPKDEQDFLRKFYLEHSFNK